MTAPPQEHAVVVGASLAGLLAARVLAEHWPQVTLVEKDPLPDDPAQQRRGVPQGAHIHVLWSEGRRVLEQLLPGLFDELAAAGAVSFDNSADMRWFHAGVWKLRHPSGMALSSQSRPLLEHAVRRRVLAAPNIRVQRGAVAGLDIVDGRIRGAHLKSGAALPADLLLDATGKGNQLPRWLLADGWPAPRESTVGIDLQYATRLYRPPPGKRDWQVMAVYPRPPHARRAGVIFPIEGNRWIVTLGGCLGDHPGRSAESFDTFAAGLPAADLHAALDGAEPLGDVASVRFPEQRLRHWHKLRRRPAGLLVLGDAYCSFNPLYGQGITVAAQQAEALQACLTKGGTAGLEARYFRRAAGIIRPAWLLATATDLLYPEAEGRRPAWLKPLGRYTDRVLALSANDPTAMMAFLRVLHMARSPLHLASPPVLRRVLASALGRT